MPLTPDDLERLRRLAAVASKTEHPASVMETLGAGVALAREVPALLDAVARLTRERDERQAGLDVVRGIVEEMKSDATRPKGGQSVGPRRSPVPLSVILELERALRPEQGQYTAQAYYDLHAEVDRLHRLGSAARDALTILADGCTDWRPGKHGAEGGLRDAMGSAIGRLASALGREGGEGGGER